LFAFFSYSGERFFILYKKSEETREIRNVHLVGNTASSYLCPNEIMMKEFFERELLKSDFEKLKVKVF